MHPNCSLFSLKHMWFICAIHKCYRCIVFVCQKSKKKYTVTETSLLNVDIYQKFRTGSILDHYAIKYILLCESQSESSQPNVNKSINETKNKKQDAKFVSANFQFIIKDNRVEGLTFREKNFFAKHYISPVDVIANNKMNGFNQIKHGICDRIDWLWYEKGIQEKRSTLKQIRFINSNYIIL